MVLSWMAAVEGDKSKPHAWQPGLRVGPDKQEVCRAFMQLSRWNNSTCRNG
ncbi:hypothetical protein OHAE_2210 [Ochrobactrum soli]|uniref:Uncharacterized protein n=1 Tax=Ochrobactrum soli TaxID=2448455 RepID=A0A2P9HQV4_9HYPH|nr:hypothetical protein OHAE_2210 [[Ochrobactrum] soli]